MTHTSRSGQREAERELRGGLTQIRESNNSKSSEKHASRGSDRGNWSGKESGKEHARQGNLVFLIF